MMLKQNINYNANQSFEQEDSLCKNSDLQSLRWKNFSYKLELQFGKEIFDKWLSKLELYSLSEYEMIMSISSKFLRDWIKREYLENGIKQLAVSELPNLKKVSIIHIEKEETIQVSNNQNPNAIKQTGSSVVNLSKYDNVFAIGTDLNPKFTFENFIAGKSNQLVFQAAKIMRAPKKITKLYCEKKILRKCSCKKLMLLFSSLLDCFVTFLSDNLFYAFFSSKKNFALSVNSKKILLTTWKKIC